MLLLLLLLWMTCCPTLRMATAALLLSWCMCPTPLRHGLLHTLPGGIRAAAVLCCPAVPTVLLSLLCYALCCTSADVLLVYCTVLLSLLSCMAWHTVVLAMISLLVHGVSCCCMGIAASTAVLSTLLVTTCCPSTLPSGHGIGW